MEKKRMQYIISPPRHRLRITEKEISEIQKKALEVGEDPGKAAEAALEEIAKKNAFLDEEDDLEFIRTRK